MSVFKEMLRSVAARATRDRSSGLALLAAVFAPAVLALVLVAVVTPSLGASEAMPVALVNLDRGAEDAAGHEVRAGEDLVGELLDSGDVAWVETDRATADSGLASGDFALIVQIPENYSEQVASLEGDEPERAQIQVISDGSQNVLATREGAQVMRQVQQRLRGELGEDYLVSVLNDVNGEASRLTLAADGAVVLDDAYDVLEQGAAGVATGLEQTAAGTGVLVQGVDGIAQGVGALGAGNQALAEGIDMVNEQAATPLAAGSEALVAGLDQAADGLTTIAQGIDGAGALASGANELLSQSSSSLASLAGLSGELAAPAQELSQAQAQMASVSGSVLDAAEDATQGIEQARGGVDAASEAAGALASTVNGADGTGGVIADASAVGDAASNWLGADGRAQIIALAAAFEAEAAGGPLSAERQALIDAYTADAQAYQESAPQLEQGIQTISQQAADLASAAGEATDGIDAAASSIGGFSQASASFQESAAVANGAAASIADLLDNHDASISSSLAGVAAAQQMLDQVPGLTGPLSAGVEATASLLSSDGLVGSGAAGVSTGVRALSQALGGFSSASVRIGEGNVALGQAISAMGAGVSGLGDGLGALASVQGQLAQGIGQLGEGSQTITETMQASGEALQDISSAADDRAEAASWPVTLTTTVVNEVPSTASQVAPIALAAALWLGALMCSYVIAPYDRRALLVGGARASVLAPAALHVLFGLVQGAVAMALLAVFGGVQAASLPALVALVLDWSVAMALIAQLLRLVLGDAAGPVSLGMLVLQLLCAGAILPAYAVGGILGAFAQVLPVPVFASALRAAVAGATVPLGSVIVLAAWLVAAIALMLALVRLKRRVRPERLGRSTGISSVFGG